MSDFITDRLQPSARGTPVATHTERQDSQARATRRRKIPKQVPAQSQGEQPERAEELVRHIDQMA
jgi:hypothetical protein